MKWTNFSEDTNYQSYSRRYKLSDLIQEDTNYQASFKKKFKILKIEFVAKSLSKRKLQDQIGFKEEIIPIVYKLLQKIEEKEIISNSLNETSITLMPKPGKKVSLKKTTYLHSL